jgi:hypothetical protein
MTDIVGAVMVESAINKLHKSIDKFNEQTVKQNRRMLQLTVAIVVLTAVMTLAVGFQIHLALSVIP